MCPSKMHSLISRLFLFLLINVSNDFNAIGGSTTTANLSSSDSNSRLLDQIANRSVQERSKRAVTSRPERKWNQGIIPYEIEPFKFKGIKR